MADNMISQPQLLGAVDRIMKKKSLAYRISDVQPMSGPLGVIVGARRDKVNNKLIIERKELEPVTEKIDTIFTQEAIQDYMNIYKEDVYDVLAHYLVDEINYRLDARFIQMLKSRARDYGTMTFNAVDFKNNLFSVGQAIGIRIVKGLSSLPLSDNRSSNGFCIVSSDVAAVLSLTSTLGDPNQSPNEEDSSPSYMGTLAGIDFYIDFTHDNSVGDNVIFGIKGNGISKGTSIISPYTREWVETIDSSTGEKVFFLFDRTGMTINPLDDEFYQNGAGSSAFVGKFNVDLTDLALELNSIINV